jgi:lipopolysaccharide export system protein LptA
MKPRVESGALQLSADKVDVSEASGDAFARGNVKASWVSAAPRPGTAAGSGAPSGIALGGQGPAHVIAAEAQLHQATGEATFRGQVRLWQQANSISAPVVVLDKTRQTVVARGTSAADPVRVVMLTAEGSGMGKNEASGSAGEKTNPPKTGHGADGAGGSPAVIRVRGGEFKYSDAERKAVMHAGPAGKVVADNGSAAMVSNDLELVLLPPGNHAGEDGSAAQVDHVTATGHVTLSSQGRRGTGERLVYSGETGEYVLTGTAAHPPTLTDPGRGMVSGVSLIFNSRDDSVSIEGGGQQKTVTETVAPK